VASSENCRQDVGGSKVGNGELSRIVRKKSPNAPKWPNIEVTLCPRGGMASWMKAFNMSARYQLFWTTLRTTFTPLAVEPPRFETRLRAEESTFKRVAGAASIAEQSRRAAKSARWDGLTFDTKGEMIIFVRRNSRFARTLDAVLALSCAFILPSLLGSCLLRIRNS
jgi:hypothetical protein